MYICSQQVLTLPFIGWPWFVITCSSWLSRCFRLFHVFLTWVVLFRHFVSRYNLYVIPSFLLPAWVVAQPNTCLVLFQNSAFGWQESHKPDGWETNSWQLFLNYYLTFLLVFCVWATKPFKLLKDRNVTSRSHYLSTSITNWRNKVSLQVRRCLPYNYIIMSWCTHCREWWVTLCTNVSPWPLGFQYWLEFTSDSNCTSVLHTS
jgi:hypothetical protein